MLRSPATSGSSLESSPILHDPMTQFNCSNPLLCRAEPLVTHRLYSAGTKTWQYVVELDNRSAITRVECVVRPKHAPRLRRRTPFLLFVLCAIRRCSYECLWASSKQIKLAHLGATLVSVGSELSS